MTNVISNSSIKQHGETLFGTLAKLADLLKLVELPANAVVSITRNPVALAERAAAEERARAALRRRLTIARKGPSSRSPRPPSSINSLTATDTTGSPKR